MGSYWDLKIGKYKVLSGKNYVAPDEIMTIFRERDHAIRGKGRAKKFGYTAKASEVIDRLDCMGFTLIKAEKDFNKNFASALREEERFYEEYNSPSNISDIRYLNFLSVFNYRKWRRSASRLITANISEDRFQAPGHNTEDQNNYFYRWIGDDYIEEKLFGFPCSDIRFFLRAFLSLFEPDKEITLDYTDLVHGGWLGQRPKLSETAFSNLTDQYSTNESILVLTEGSTDARFLKETLSLLYPHLSESFAFLDFDLSNAGGGAPALVALIKGFVGARMKNRVIALFDNDAAALDAMRPLSRVRLPAHIKAIRLPSLDMAKNYPTVGPQGSRRSNINGRALSLEFFFGRDVLKDPDGRLMPVQWKSHIPGVQKYQGEVIDKLALQSRFKEKLRKAINSRASFKESDWSEMRLLFARIFETVQKM